MIRYRRAILLVLAVGLAGCSTSADLRSHWLDVQNAVEREEVATLDAWLDPAFEGPRHWDKATTLAYAKGWFDRSPPASITLHDWRVEETDEDEVRTEATLTLNQGVMGIGRSMGFRVQARWRTDVDPPRIVAAHWEPWQAPQAPKG